MTWRVTAINIRGVKGVLDRAGDFDLRDGNSIAIFAPNGCGKSGYADAIEYLFSLDGAVEHLGQGPVDSERGGKHAIPHILAEERGIVPQVSLRLRDSTSHESLDVTRLVKVGRSDEIPSELGAIIRRAPAHRILRQHDLRRFVVDLEPRAKYSELSRWLALSQLEQVLAHLTTTSQSLERASPDREVAERLQDVASHTNQGVSDYDEGRTLQWCAGEATRLLGTNVAVGRIEDLEGCLRLLKERRDSLVLLAGKMTEPYKAKVAIEAVAAELTGEAGKLARCDTAFGAAVAATRKVELTRSEARESICQEIWNCAQTLLENHAFDQCPVCLTPWQRTQVGSQENAVSNLRASLEGLAVLARAQSEERDAARQLQVATDALVSDLRQVEAAATTLALPDIAKKASELAAALGALCQVGDPPSSQEEHRGLSLIARGLGAELLSILQSLHIEGLPAAAEEVDTSIEHIRSLRDTLARLAELQREGEEYRTIEGQFAAVAKAIQERAASLVDTVVSMLQDEVGAIYRKIHPSGAVPNIHIVPDTQSKTLLVRVDFHFPGRTVPPAGYLSESYINTLGLALFLSSVRLFNQDLPFLFLDDIVSSYDADHRARIVDVIAEDLADAQVFLTTHDERFYSMLRARLSGAGWQFERITGWTLDTGPRREADLLKTEQIEGLILEGDPQIAGNAVRQHMEQWLDDMCARFRAYTPHRRGPKEFERTLFDFWGPFIHSLKEVKGGFLSQRVKPQVCYQRLSSHQMILNYYSHAQANPYDWTSIGDVKYVWEEFGAFKGLFLCQSCSSPLLYDAEQCRLYCACGGLAFPQEVPGTQR